MSAHAYATAPRATTRIYQPKDFILFKTPTGNCGANGQASIYFVVPTPSARISTKIALFWWPSITGQSAAILGPPSQIDVSQSGNLGPYLLNLWSAEQSETGWWIPTVDLLGTSVGLAGQEIPLGLSLPNGAAINGLGGFSIDVQGGQGGVTGLLTIASTAGYVGKTGINLSMRVRYEAQGTEMCQDEWEELKQKLSPSAPQTVIFV